MVETNWTLLLFEEYKKIHKGPYHIKHLSYNEWISLDEDSFFRQQLKLLCPYELGIPFQTEEDDMIKRILQDIQSVDSNTDYAYSITYVDGPYRRWTIPILCLSNKAIASMLIITYNYKSWNGE